MNLRMMKCLIGKEWHLLGWVPFAYLLAGIISTLIFNLESKTASYVGLVLIITIFATSGIHLVFGSVISERKNQTLPFIMSLPITFKDYTLAKLLSSFSMSFLIWGVLSLFIFYTIDNSSTLNSGLIPYTAIVIAYMFVLYLTILCTALVTESEAVTIVVMGICNVSISVFMFWLSGHPEIKAYMGGDFAVWNSTTASFFFYQILIVIVLVGLTFFFQSRKTEFI